MTIPKIKKERYSRMPRLSDTRYSAKESKREMEIDKQQSKDCKAPPTFDFNIWLCGWQTDLSVMGVTNFY